MSNKGHTKRRAEQRQTGEVTGTVPPKKEPREIETKIVDFDEGALIRALRKANAQLTERGLFRTWVFYIPTEEGTDKFIRVRNDGRRSTLTYKFRKGEGLDNTIEIKTEVADFNATSLMLMQFIPMHHYQEQKYETYSFDGTEVSVRRLPMISSPALEIEAESAAKIDKVIRALGIKGRILGNVSWEQVYLHYGLHVEDFKELRFGENESPIQASS